MSDKDQNATFKKALAIHGELLNELRLIFNSKDREYLVKYENLTTEKRKECDEFVKFYSLCPRCHKPNPRYNLIGIFLDDSPNKKEIKEKLINLMRKQKETNPALSVGVLCCKCFLELFDKQV
jgi:hypothetical protein